MSARRRLAGPGAGVEHPRSCGAAPRRLRRCVAGRPVITMAGASRSRAGLPAQVLAVPHRDVATYARPDLYSAAVGVGPVSGRPAIDRGDGTGARGGKVLLRGRT